VVFRLAYYRGQITDVKLYRSNSVVDNPAHGIKVRAWPKVNSPGELTRGVRPYELGVHRLELGGIVA
jgi:hypothetical protein